MKLLGGEEAGFVKQVGLTLGVKEKKEAKLSAREIPGVEKGKCEEDLRCKSSFTVCQRCLGLSEDDETGLE